MRRALIIHGLTVTVIAAFSWLLASEAHAVNLKASPTISLEETWDSNIFNSSTDEESDFIFRARPGVTLFLEAFQTTMKVSGGFEVERYADHSEEDDETATMNLDLTTAAPLRITPRFSIHPSAGYVETQDSARRNLLAPAPEPGIPPSESVVTARTKTRDYRAALRLQYSLAPRVDISVGGGWSRRDFLGDNVVVDGEDSKTVTGDLNVGYRVTPRFSSGVFANMSKNSFEQSPDSTIYSGGLTGNYLLTQSYKVDARAGASYLKEDGNATTPENDQWAPYGSVSLTYTWQYFQASLAGSYELAGGGSFGETTKRGTVQLSLTNQFATRWWWNLGSYYQSNKSAGDQTTEDIDTIGGSAGIRYAAAEWASVRLSGNVLRQRSNGVQGEDIDRDSVFLGVDLSTIYKLF